jgi:hypothetical protein
MCPQVLQTFFQILVKFSQLYAKFSQLFAKFSQMFTLFRCFFVSAHILTHFLLAKIRPNFYETHYCVIHGKSFKFVSTHTQYPHQLRIRRIGKRAHFKVQSPWMYISAKCLLKFIYNFYMCAGDF